MSELMACPHCGWPNWKEAGKVCAMCGKSMEAVE